MTTAPTTAVTPPRASALEWAIPLSVGALTLLAFVLRLAGMDQSLFADELFTYQIATQGSLGDVVPAVQVTENNPPLYYLLAWCAAQLGDPTVWIRVPALILGTATVPLLYLLGRRTVGAGAGALAAAFAALSPFAIFYSTEARAYAPLAFFVALSTLLLLVALEERAPRWWLAYGGCACLVLYTHYTGVFAVGAQAAWALWSHRDLARALVIVYGGVALAYVPWLPYYSDQNTFFGFDKLGAPLSGEAVLRGSLISVSGHPFIPLEELPGVFALVVLAGAAAVVLAALATASLRGRWKPAKPPPGVGLLALLALASPVSLVLYSALGTDIWVARNLSASLPAVYLLVAALIASLGSLVRLAAACLVLLGLGVGAVKTLDEDNARPPLKQAAERIDRRASAGDPVIDILFQPNYPALKRGLQINFERRHRVYRGGVDDDAAWRKAARGSHVFMVVAQVGPLKGIPRRSGPSPGYPLQSARILPGFMPVGVFEYAREGAARP